MFIMFLGIIMLIALVSLIPVLFGLANFFFAGMKTCFFLLRVCRILLCWGLSFSSGASCHLCPVLSAKQLSSVQILAGIWN